MQTVYKILNIKINPSKQINCRYLIISLNEAKIVYQSPSNHRQRQSSEWKKLVSIHINISITFFTIHNDNNFSIVSFSLHRNLRLWQISAKAQLRAQSTHARSPKFNIEPGNICVPKVQVSEKHISYCYYSNLTML